MAIAATRMERNNQRNKARVAKRGHKLLKDKTDEMFRTLTELIHEREKIAANLNADVVRAVRQFLLARVYMSSTEIDNAINATRMEFLLQPEMQNIMGLRVPKLSVKHPGETAHPTPNFLTTHKSFDTAVGILENIMNRLVELASIDKTCTMLDAEIRRLRRRVNALEHAVIPQINENIASITGKLAENERGNLVRLIKVKEIINENS